MAVDDPVATVVATNISINITWSTGENIRDFKSVFYNVQLIEHGRLSNTTVNSNTVNNFQWFGSKPYTSYTFLLTAFNRLGLRSNTVQETFITAEGCKFQRNMSFFNFQSFMFYTCILCV